LLKDIREEETKMKTYKLAVAMALVSTLAGCGVIGGGPKLAANPPPSTLRSASWSGEFAGEAHVQDDVGGMSVVYLRLRNDTDVARSISMSRMFGVTDEDKKIAALSSGEADEMAADGGNSSGWARAGTGLAAGAVGGAVVGGAAGAIGGAILGPPGMAAGAAIGAAIGGGTGAIVGAIAGAFKPSSGDATRVSPAAKIRSDRLSDQVIDRGSQAQGYVFLPKENYKEIRLIVSSTAEGTEELTVPMARRN
jgi:hypothetical protein